MIEASTDAARGRRKGRAKVTPADEALCSSKVIKGGTAVCHEDAVGPLGHGASTQEKWRDSPGLTACEPHTSGR